jgi:hypothetical protein
MTDSSYPAGRGHEALTWPSDPAQFVDTTLCPSCFARLTGVVCSACGLDLSVALAREVLEAGRAITTAETARQTLIAAMRIEQVARAATVHTAYSAEAPEGAVDVPPPTLPLPVWPAPSSAQPQSHEAAFAPPALPAASPAPPAPPVLAQGVSPPAPSHPEPSVRSRVRKHSSVQIALLIVGVSLVSVAAIFFVTVAWVVTGLAVRSAIAALATLGALAVAGLLRRRCLTATAEGIGALAIVLVLIDLWATRANDLFGAAASDALMFWGVGTLVCAVILLGLNAVSGLRAASVAGFALVPLSVGLLGGAVAEPLDLGAQIAVSSLAAAVGAAAWVATLARRASPLPAADRLTERIVLYAALFAALAIALGSTPFADPHSDWVPVGWCLAVSLIAGAHGWLALRLRRHVVIACCLAAIGVVAFALIALQVAWRIGDSVGLVTAPALAAVVLALGAEVLGRSATAGSRSVAQASVLTARVMAGCLLVPTVLWAAWPLAQALLHGATATRSPFVEVAPANNGALLALAASCVLVGSCWAGIRRLPPRLGALAWAVATLLVLAVPFVVALSAVVIGFVVVTAGCLLCLITGRNRAGSTRFRPHLIALMCAAQAAGFIAGWASSGTWWIGVVSAVLIVYGARYLVRGANRWIARPILTGSAVLLTLVVAGVAPWMLTLGRSPGPQVTSLNVIGGLTLGTAILAVIGAVPWRRFLRPLERRTVFCTLAPFATLFLYPVGAVAHALPSIQSAGVLQPEPAASVVRAIVLLSAVLLWLAVPGNRGFRAVRRGAGMALTPALGLVAVAAATAADAPREALPICAALASLVGAAVALAVGLRPPSGTPPYSGPGSAHPGRLGPPHIRFAIEIGAAVVCITALWYAVVAAPDIVWFVVLITAVALLMAAVTSDGLFGSRSWRRRLGWASLALGVGALWMRLSGSHVDVIEAYVLPVSAALLTVAGLLQRYGSGRDRMRGPSGPVVLVFAALLITAVPLSLAAFEGPLLRPLIVGGSAAAVLVTVAAVHRRAPAGRLIAGWSSVAVGVPTVFAVVLVAGGRAADIVAHSVGRSVGRSVVPITFDLWLGSAAVVLCVSGLLVAAPTPRPIEHAVRTRVVHGASAGRASAGLASTVFPGTMLTGIGLALGLLPTTLAGATGSPLRATVVLGLAAAASVCGARVLKRPPWRSVGWTAIAVGLAGVCASASGRVLGLFGDDGPVDGRLEAWLLPTVAVIAVVAMLIGPNVLAQSLLIGAMAVVLASEVAALAYAPLTVARVVLLTWTFSAIHAVVFWLGRRPLTPLVGWLALAVAAVAAVAGASRLDPTPFELASLPIAGALLVSGSLRLMLAPGARSWPWLGPGIAVLLVPSLVIGFWDAPLWRIVSLGVAATVVIVLGLVLRLQAPFLVGCVVALVHAVVQLWPWIAAVYQATQWWLWIGVGGVILIALAARYERRIRDVKAVVLRISALR